MAFANAKQYFGGLVSDLRAAPSGSRFSWGQLVGLPLAVLALLTSFAWLTGFDLQAELAIFNAGEGSWKFGEHSLWWFLYRFGTFPAMIVAFVSIAGFLGSWKFQKLREWRKLFLFNILLGVIAPGIITNLALKEYWGRPRPRDVVEFGGHNQFEQVLTMDRTSDGKSFPCGHATMGFYFMGGFFLLRRHRRKLAWGILAFGTIFGLLMGIARMVQGSHFFTDVIWAGAVCYFTGAALYFALKIDRGALTEPSPGKLPKGVKIGATLLSLAILVGVIFASPYQDRRNWFLVEDYSKKGPLQFRLILALGNIEVVPAEELLITGEAYGHGVPTSKIGEQFLEIERKNGAFVVYKEELRGRFSEINEDLRVELPWHRIRMVEIDVGEAKLDIDLAGVEGKRNLRIRGGTGSVIIKAGDANLEVSGSEGKNISDDRSEPEIPSKKPQVISIEIGEAFEGSVQVVD